MTPFSPLTRTSGARRALGWIIATVIALQALGVSAALGRGPSHTHVAPRAASVLLLDARRGGFDTGGSAADTDLSRWIGHHHVAAARHFHAAGDATVVVSVVDQRIDAAADDGAHALDLVAASLMAVMTTTLLWLVTAAIRHGKASHTGWQPSLGFFQRLDRPPQSR